MRPLCPRSPVFLVRAPIEADHRWGQTPRLHALEHHPASYTSSWVLTLCLVRIELATITGLVECEAEPEVCAPCCYTIAVAGFRGRVVTHAVAE